MVNTKSESLQLLFQGISVALLSGLAGLYIGSSTRNKNHSKAGEDEDVDEALSDVEIQDAHGGEPCKMVLIVRKDLPMTKGKIAAQCAHAALACYEKAIERTPQNVISWKSQGQAKIALQVDSLDELKKLQVRAARLGVIAEHIVDAGRTQIDPGSVTVLGLGPAPVALINEISGRLKLL